MAEVCTHEYLGVFRGFFLEVSFLKSLLCYATELNAGLTNIHLHPQYVQSHPLKAVVTKEVFVECLGIINGKQYWMRFA